MSLPTSFISETIADNTVRGNGTPETTSWSLPVTALTAANLVAQTTLINALYAAIAATIIGTVQKTEIVQSRLINSSSPAASTLAQRENKWLLRYHGVTLNQKFQMSIGTADLTILTANSEKVDLTGGVGLALKTAFDAVVKSPDDGAESVVLDSMQFVGRNT